MPLTPNFNLFLAKLHTFDYFFSLLPGFEPPKIVCASALGIENGKIPDSAMVASSRHNQYWGPERGRLNEQNEGN